MRPEVSILAAGLTMRRNRPVRGGATQDQTDVKSFDWMEPMAGGFRTYQRQKFNVPAEEYWWAACGRLTNDFFVNLLSMDTVWRAQNDDRMVFDANRFDARRQLDPQ